MKMNIDIECSPEEARSFLGLPDLSSIQTSFVRQLQAKMEENIANLDPEHLARMWMPSGMPGMGGGWQDVQNMQKMFWQGIAGKASQAPLYRTSAREQQDTAPPRPVTKAEPQRYHDTFEAPRRRGRPPGKATKKAGRPRGRPRKVA